MLLGDRVETVVKRDFKDFRSVEIACEQISLLAEGSHFDTSAASAFTCVFERFARTYHFLDVGVGVEDRRIAVSLTDDLKSCFKELVGSVLGNMDGQTWLQLMEFFLDFKNHVRNLVGSALSVAFHSTDIDISEVVVCTRFQCGDTYLRRCRLVVELYPEAGEQFLGCVACQAAVGNALLVERNEVLIDMPRVHAVPTVEFGNGAEMHEPVHLYGFPQVAWSMSWYPTANACYFLQFQLALRVRFLGCHFLGKFGVTLSKEYCCIAGN